MSQTNTINEAEEKEFLEFGNKKGKKYGFNFWLKIIIIIFLIGILLTSFLKIIFNIDTADTKGNNNVKRWESVAGPLPNSGSSSISGRGGTVVQKAIECHKYVRENGYTYGRRI